jgi:hypothetical protein
MLADYAVADPQGGKTTMVGAGITVASINPDVGMTAAFAVFASASFDPKFIGSKPTIELSLETADGQLISLPGQPGPLRFTASERLNPTRLPGADVPNEAVRPKMQILIQFQNGLPLAPGQKYIWRMRVDGESRDEWTETLYIPIPTAAPRIG